MAASNENFSTLDPLGSGFGKIEQPSLDEQGFSAFEGDRLSTPRINFPEKKFVPMLPPSTGLVNHQVDVRKNVVGTPSAPIPKGKGLSPNDFAKSLDSYYSAKEQTNQDANEYARIYSYDAGPAGNNFYKRYAAYGEETFNDIGFHPFRDNEAIFNESTSGWQDTKRMMVHSFWPLMKQGFVSGPKSLFKAMQGDFSPDTEDAKMFAEAAAIGNSTKGGFGAFMNNAALSFGYTAGIITEALLEEAGLLLLEAATMGGATPVVAAGTAANVAKLGRIPGAISKLNEIDNLGEGASAINSTIKAMDNINDARKFYDASKTNKIASSIGKFFNPIENTTDAFRTIFKNEDNLTGLARVMDSSKKAFGGFYGDIKSINMALSEARLEGGMQQNEMYNELYDDFYAENGRAPSDAEQRDFLKVSKEAGMSSLVWNTALIFASNKIVLDNIVGRKGGIKNLMKSKTAELLDLDGGKVIKTTKDITLKSTGRKFQTPGLEWRETNLWNTVKAFKEQPFKSALTGSISYFKRNITEGLQENAQEVISQATKAYYMDAYNNPNVATHSYARGLVQNAIKDQFSAQGFETLASGMVMGMFSAPLNAVPTAFSIGYNKIFDKEAYEKYKIRRDLHGKNTVSSMTSVDLKDFFDNNLVNYGMQSSAQDDRISGDDKAGRDASDSAFIMQMNTVLDKGMMDYYVSQLESFEGLTAEEIEEVIPSIPKGEGAKYLEKLPETIERAKRLEKKHKFWNDRFPSPVNINSISKDDPNYEDAALTWHAWETAKRNAIFFNESYDNTMSRMSSIMNDLDEFVDLSGAAFNDIKVLFDQRLMVNEKEMLQSEIETLKASGGKATDITAKEKKLEAYDQMNEALLNFKAHFTDRNKIVQKLMEQYPDLSEEQFNEIIEQKLGVRDEQSDKEQEALLKDAFDKYLVAISTGKDKTPFASDIDEAFIKFRDYNLLSNESRSLAEAVNLLHDPKGFFEHVQRNKVWMKELYDNRSEYYNNLVEQEFRKKEGNDLLNHLASQNLYISSEDFRRWREQNILPEEIYDASKKIVIRRSNPLYDDIIRPFQMIAEVQSKRTDVEITDAAIKEQLSQLEAETLQKIEALETTDQKVNESSLDFGRAKSINYKKIMAQTQDGDYVDVEFELNEGTGNATFYKDGDELKYLNKDGKIVEEANLKAELGTNKFTKAVKYNIEAKPNQDEYDQIMQDFEEKKAELIKKAAESKDVSEEEAEAAIETPIYTTDTPLVDMPADLYNQLAEAFDEYTKDTDLAELTGDDYDNALASFVMSNIIAARIIDDFNGDQKLAKAMTAQPVEASLNINGKIVPLKDISEKDLRGYLKDLQLRAKNLEAKTDRTLEDNTALADAIYGIRKLQEHLEERKTRGYTPEQQATIKLLEKLVKGQDAITKGKGGYIIDNELYSRVTSIIAQFQEAYSYRDETAVKATFNTTIGVDGFNQASIENFISQLKKQKLSGFSGYTYESLRNELMTKLQETPDLSGEDLTNAIMATVAETTYESSRVTGNYIDDQIRNVFDGVPPVFNENNITKEAFEALFGTDPENPGYVTNIKSIVDKEGLFVLSRVKLSDGTERGLVLYDKNAKIAGEVDLMAVDRSGNVFIIDVKTGQFSKWKYFDNNAKGYSKKDAYTLQQTAYANLLYNQIGKQASVSLLPIELEYDNESSQITRGGRPAAPGLLAPGMYRIPLPISDDIQAKIDSVIPRNIAAASTTKPLNKEELNARVNEAIKEVFGKKPFKTLFDFNTSQPGTTIRGEFIPANLGEQMFKAINSVLTSSTKETFGKEEFESSFDFNTGQPGKVIRGEFIPENLGSQIFNAINKVLNGKATKVDAVESEKLFRDYAKVVHPDMHQSPEAKIIGDAFFKAMVTAKEQNRVDLLKELKKKFDEELDTLNKLQELSEKTSDLQQATPTLQQKTIVDGDTEDLVTLEDEGVETPAGEQIIDLDIESLKEPILQASQDVLDAFKSDMAKAIAENNISSESIIAVQELIDIRQRELNSNPVIQMTVNNVQKDTQVVAGGTIFTKKDSSKIFATDGDTVRVKSVNKSKNTATLEAIQQTEKIQETFSFEELNKMFILKEPVMNVETVETPPAPLTKTEKNFINDSMDLVNELLKNNERKEALKKEAAGQSLDQVDTELFEDETSNC